MAKFVNPYNFISLKDKKSVAIINDNDKKYTGYLNLEIELKTPLIIPNTSAIQTSEHKNYSYYSYQDLSINKENTMPPVIPGSELRGCIRSIHEALNNSCLSTINEDNIFTRRVEMYSRKHDQKETDVIEMYNSETCKKETLVKYNDEYVSDGVAAVKRGIIEKNQDGSWSLYDVKSYDIVQMYEYYIKRGECIFAERTRKFGFPDDNIWFENLDLMTIEDKGEDVEGVLVISERHIKPKTKHSLGKNTDFYRIEVWKKQDKVNKKVSKDDIEKLKYLIEQYQDPKVNTSLRNNPIKPYEKYGKLTGDSYPIYYQILNINEENVLYLSPSMVGRQALSARVGDKIKDYKPCDGDTLCPTCALFGMISNDKSLASRVRFLDASATTFKISSPITLLSLANPKFTNVDFYGTDGNFNQHLSLFDLDNVSIRGRKFYWHHKPHHKNEKATRLNTTVTPIEANSKFKSKVYFESITAKELYSLIVAVTLVDDEHGQKIGMGKPYGYGSINIKVPNMNIREIILSNTIEYKETNINLTYSLEGISYILDGMEQKIAKLGNSEIANMTRFDATRNYTVCYPYTTAEGVNNYEWFTNNKKDHKKLPSAINLNEIYLETNQKPITKQEKTNDFNNNNSSKKNNNYHR